MKQKVFWLLTMLMTLGVSSMWATNAPEDSWRYQVRLDGTTALRLEMPCYDRTNSDSWVKEGYVYITPDGGTKQTLFYYASETDISNDRTTVGIYCKTEVGGTMTLERSGMSSYQVTSRVEWVGIPFVKDQEYAIAYLRWIIPSEFRGKNVRISWDIDKDGNTSEDHKKIDISPVDIFIPAEPEPIKPQLVDPLLSYNEMHRNEIMLPYIMAAQEIQSLTATYNTAPAGVTDKSAYWKTLKLDTQSSGYLYLPADATISELKLTAQYINTDKKLVTTHSDPITVPMMHQPQMMTAAMLNDGSALVQWRIADNGWPDIQTSDSWEVQRNVDGDPVNGTWTMVGQLEFSPFTYELSYTDNTLLQAYKGKPVFYRVRRMMTSMWGWHTRSDYAQCQLLNDIVLPSFVNPTAQRNGTWSDENRAVNINFALGGSTSQYDSQRRFIIRSAADWDTYCELLRSNSSLSAVMANDIELNESNKKVGQYNFYEGVFDGNGYTVTYNYKSGKQEVEACLFYRLDGATIRNLHIAGTIETNSSSRYPHSALVGRCAETTIENCRVSATFKLTGKNDKAAGFIGETARRAFNHLSNCVFDGRFICPEANDNCAGFVCSSNSAKEELVLTNCVFNPAELKNCSGQNFVRSGDATLSVCFATNNMNVPGTESQQSDPHYDEQGRFIIMSAADWETFRNKVATAHGADVNAVLAADITVTTMTGTNDDNKYYGTFDGGGHTITFNDTGFNEYTALFAHVGTCTIKNLYVTGQVVCNYNSGAIIGRCENNASKTITIENCRVSTYFDLYMPQLTTGGYLGGFIGQANAAKVVLRNNLFDGHVKTYYNFDNIHFGVFVGNGYKTGTDVSENNLDDGIYDITNGGNVEVELSYDSQGQAISPAGMMKRDGKSNAELLALLGNQWTEEDGKVVPKMETYSLPSKTPDDTMTRLERLEHIALLVGEDKMELMGNTIVPKMELNDDPELKTAIWDDRAKAYLYTDKLVGGKVISTSRQELSKEQMADGKVALDITTPCVDHQFRLAVSRSTSPLLLPKDSVASVQKIDEGALAIYEFNNNVEIVSLKADTLQSGVKLSWETNGGDADGYTILRRDKMAYLSEKADTLQSNYQHQQFTDNTVAPHHSYIYTVEGITQCQGEHKSSKQVEGACKATGMVRGYVRMANGVGMPGVKVWARKAESSPEIIGYQARSCVTDSTGYYEIGELMYQQSAVYEITVESTGDAASFPAQQVEFNDISNLASNIVFTQTQYAVFSGTVMFEGSSIPVSGVRFMRDNVQVTDGAGNAVTTDAQGHFSLSIPYGDHTVQVVKEGHVFKNDGYLIDPDSHNPDKRVHNWSENIASYYFWDQTRVNLRGRVVGGNTQGQLPLGKSLSKNNLGDSLTVVFQLEGDNASWIVRDQNDPTIRERDSLHLHGFNHSDTTIVHASRYRIKIHPDKKTGEYELPIYPVKYKITDVYAHGYPSLFLPGSVSETIDLTALHNGDTVQWSRIYHASPSLVRQQFNGGGENYFGIKQYVATDVAGLSDTVQVWYPEVDKDGKVVKDGQGIYTLGYPVYRSGQPVSMVLTAREEYYYNNDRTKPLDTVPLDGAELIITNGFHSQEDTDPVTLDENGMYGYIFTPLDATFVQEGKNALRTMTFTLKYGGAYYEMEPIHGYLMASIAQPQGRRVLAGIQPHLVEILRDPPGAHSTAFIEKGSQLHYSYTTDYTLNLGIVLDAGLGTGVSWYSGSVTGAVDQGVIFDHEQTIGVKGNLYTTRYDKDVYDYTLDIKERIETSDESRFARYVGNGSDLYIGLNTSIIVEDALAVRLVPSAALKRLMPATGGVVTIDGHKYAVKGTVKVLASGYDAQKKDSVYLIRDEVTQITDKFQSTFVHSQAFLTEEIIPNLIRTRDALLLAAGTSPAYAQKQADDRQRPTYISKVVRTDEHFAQLGYYDVYYPTNTPDVSYADSIVGLNSQIKTWTGFIRRNEQEKLEAGRLLKNYDFDGHSSGISYSEEFNAIKANSGYWALPSVDVTGGGGRDASQQPKKEGEEGKLSFKVGGHYLYIGITPMVGFKSDYMSEGGEGVSKSTGFTLRCSTRSNLNVDVYRIAADTTLLSQKVRDGEWGAFYKLSGETLKSIIDGKDSRLQYWSADLNYGSFVFRTRGGATSQPYEEERTTQYYMPGTVLDQKTMPLDNLKIWTDQHVVSNVPYDEPARFTIKVSNESEFPARVTRELLLYLEEAMNKDGAKVFIDGHALTGSGIDLWLDPNTVIEKEVEVYPGAGFDYEDIGISIVDDMEPERFASLTLDAHFVPTAGKVNISSPGDKWVMNTDSPRDSTGYYLPVTIDGFDVTQENFDHIELQYKLSTQGDKEWVNTCSYYKDEALMAKASGVRKLITDDGHINAVFYGETDPIEQRYDLRAVVYRRHGNGYLTNSSKILSGIKDTRLPTLFGKPQPANGILDISDDIKMMFSEEIAGNYLKKENNFEVLGLTNKSNISLSTCLHLNISDPDQQGRLYGYTEVNRNLAGKSFTFDLMVLPEDHDASVVLLSHGMEQNLQIGLTKDNRMMARFNNQIVEGNKPITFTALRQLNYVFETNDEQKNTEVRFYDGNAPVGSGTINGIYEGNGPISLGSDIQGRIYDTADPELTVYRGDMLELRLWNRALSTGEMADYAQKRLTGYELGLVDYWLLNEGKGSYIYNHAVGGADIRIVMNTTWKTSKGVSLKLDGEKGVMLNAQRFNRADYHDYTLMFWFNTSQKNGTLLANGEAKDEAGSKNHFNFGVKEGELFFRGAGYEAKVAGDVADGQWHHAAVTVSRSRNVCNLYVDTKLRQSFAADTLGGIVGNTLAAGATYAKKDTPTDALKGHLDELAMFEMALTENLIKNYSETTPTGKELGTMVYVPFSRLERQGDNTQRLMPSGLSIVRVRDSQGVYSTTPDTIVRPEVIDLVADRDIYAPMNNSGMLANLNYSYVADKQNLLININEPETSIEKTHVYITLRDVADLQGNLLASPVVMDIFVHQSPLRWTEKRKTIKTQYGEPYEFNVTLQNVSGKTHNFELKDLPVWITASETNGTIDALDEKTITLTISPYINIGDYEERITIMSEDGMTEPLPLTISVRGEEPDWTVSEELKDKNISMNIVARVVINGDIANDPNDIVHAYGEGHKTLGVTHVNVDKTAGSNEALTYLIVYSPDGQSKPLNFEYYDVSTGRIYQLEPADGKRILFKTDVIVGSTTEPVVLVNTSKEVQTLQLKKGWNWLSFYVTPDKNTIGNLLDGSTKWTVGDALEVVSGDGKRSQLYTYTSKRQKANPTLYDYFWDNGTDSIQIDPTIRYRFYSDNDKQAYVTGVYNAYETVNVMPGWNRIGYVSRLNLPVGTALADYTDKGSVGDIIKSQNAFSVLTETGGVRTWKGTLTFMKSGQGYMLKRNANTNTSFFYPAYMDNSRYDGTTDSQNTVNAQRYDNISGVSMNVIAQTRGVELEAGDRLAVYSDGMLCGITEQTADGLFFLSVGQVDGGSGRLSFAIERGDDIIATTPAIMTYISDSVSGSVGEPTLVNFTTIERFADGSWYDIQGRKLPKKPTRKGIYIYNGQKTIVE